MDKITGPSGATGPMPKHHNLEDFKEGYFPHVICCIGAMCCECEKNLLSNQEVANNTNKNI